MSPPIYKSSHPDVSVPTCSIFTYLLSSDSKGNIGGFPGHFPAFIDAESGSTLTRSTLRALSLSLAYSLINGHTATPLKKGDTILLFSPNSITFPLVLFGAIAGGLRVTLANSAYQPAELEHQWHDSGAKMIFAHPALMGTVKAMFEKKGLKESEWKKKVVVASNEWITGKPDDGTNPLTRTIPHVPSLLSHGSLPTEVSFSTPALANQTAFLCYSSGTTGKPKGVETTHRNVTSVITIVQPVFPLMDRDDVMLGVLPFYHIYGAVKLLHFPLLTGTPVVVMPKFDPEVYCSSIQRYKVTISLVVPPMLLVLGRHPATSKYDLSTLKLLFSGAAPLGSVLVNATRNKLHSLGCKVEITQGYGLTETSPTTHILPPEHSLRKVGSIGVLLPNLEARLVVDEGKDGVVDVKPGSGDSGELWVRGPNVMKGYLNNKKATKDSITPDGWFRTGDVCIRDEEGFYTIVDRRKELIKYKGFQVPPAELESVLLDNKDVADVAVIGIDSREEETELPRAYVVPSNPSSLKTDSDKAAFSKGIQEWIKTRVAKHKFLRGGVVIIDVVPKSAAGKILRRELRDLAKKEVGAQAQAKL